MVSIPVIVQYRHVHLSQKEQEMLFGSDDELREKKSLKHKGQVVYKESIEIIGKKGATLSARILGPTREKTQVELSVTEAFALGIKAPVRISGDTARSATCTLKGPFGECVCKSCVIIPARHLHLNPSYAKKFGLKQHDVVTLVSSEDPDQVIDHVIVRVHPTFQLEFHLTTDEASTFWLQTGDAVHLT